MRKGQELRQGRDIEKYVPTYWIGKLARKIIDPKHKMKIGKKKDE